MLVAVGCVFFQDKDGLERLLDSCYENVDYIFLIDGRCKLYESTFPFSTDNYEDILEKYPNVVVDVAADLLEHEKRNHYLKMCKEFDIDFLLIADSDEYFYDCNWNKFRDELKDLNDDYIYNIKNYMYNPIMDSIIPVDNPRLWRKPGLLEYKNGRIYQFGLRDSGNHELQVARRGIYSIKLYHDSHLRNDERKEKHDAYIKRLEEYEQFKQLVETNKEKATREYVVWNS